MGYALWGFLSLQVTDQSEVKPKPNTVKGRSDLEFADLTFSDKKLQLTMPGLTR